MSHAYLFSQLIASKDLGDHENGDTAKEVDGL
jgi:hypothetical protein